ncbi:Golgi complex component 7-domain-containing protein [Jimgerdemannia flammicorona]|uniref:Conserved oligomeric Golgi complex subunit 7 n=1 Tax=Jimgerdemannia flammicorona TaxID=994334 RepID=A0A433QQS5_9FUNG|nr:Golgi complex component 7-domain-containing protein [Jimgerdemannia flammicorona]
MSRDDPTSHISFVIKDWINASLALGSSSSSVALHQNRPTAGVPTAETAGGEDPDANDALLAGLVDTTQDVKTFVDVYARSPTTSTTTTTTTTAFPTDQHATMLVTKLQLLSQEVSARLTHTTDAVVKNMPRVLYDLQLMKEDALATKTAVETVRNNLSRVENDTSRALERLKQLDLVKSRMEACRAALREAENWSNLESEASRIFAAGDHDRAAVRLEDARRSLDVFQNTPEYEQRRALLERLQGELERAVRPQLAQALVDHDAVACHKYFVIFERIQRRGDFMDCYFDSRTELLVKMWSEKTLMEEEGSSTEAKPTSTTTTTTTITTSSSPSSSSSSASQSHPAFTDFLSRFYQESFVVLNEEYAWCGSIFPDPRTTTQSLVRALFTSLAPTVSARLAAVVDHHGEECLPRIIAAFVATEKFGTSLERVFARPTVVAAPDTSTAQTLNSATTIASPLLRRTSGGHPTHLSMSGPKTHDDPHAWAYILYEPFHEFQRDYAAYEHNYLSNQLASALKPSDRHVDPAHTAGATDPAKLLADAAVARVFSLADAAVTRCLELTHGFAGAGLVATLNSYFEEAAREFGKVLGQVRIDCGLDAADKRAGKGVKKTGSGAVVGTKGRAATKPDRRISMDRADDSDFDFDEDELEQGEWSNFQLGLRLLAACRGMAARLTALEDRARKALGSTRSLIEDPGAEGDDDEHPFVDRARRESIIPRGDRRESLIAPLSPRHSRRESLVRSDGGGTPVPPTIAGVGAHPHLYGHVSPQSQVGPKASLSLLRQSSLNSYELGRLLSVFDQPGQALLSSASLALTGFTRACQRFVFDTVHVPIVRHLTGVAAMNAVWTADDTSSLGGRQGRSPFNLEIPQFSLSPSPYITSVGEQLLTLPQQFEVYAIDRDALAFGVEGLPFADEDGAPANKDETKQQGEDTAEFVGERETDDGVAPVDVNVNVTLPSPSIFPGSRSRSASVAKPPPTAPPAPTITAEEVTHLWYTSLSRGTMYALLDQILRVPSLSPQGARQLATDIGYLTNVLAALEIEPVPDLTRVHRVLGMDDTEVFRRLRSRAGEEAAVGTQGKGQVTTVGGARREEEDRLFETEEARALLKKVAAMRGIQLLEL